MTSKLFFVVEPARKTVGAWAVAVLLTAAGNLAIGFGLWWLIVKALCWALPQFRAAWGA